VTIKYLNITGHPKKMECGNINERRVIRTRQDDQKEMIMQQRKKSTSE
jgi:hypothetical protein